MSSSKGQEFEREQSRFLSLWWTDGQKDDIFWRNRVKVTSKTPNAERQLGDLTAFHTIGLPFVEMFNIELKSGYSKTRFKQAKKANDERNKKRFEKGKEPIALSVKNVPWDLLDIIDGKSIDDNLEILNFWRQCESDAKLSNRIPLLIFKRDFHLPVVCIQKTTFHDIFDYQGQSIIRFINLFLGDDFLTFYRHSDFFEWLNPETIKIIHSNKIQESIKDRMKSAPVVYRKRE